MAFGEDFHNLVRFSSRVTLVLSVSEMVGTASEPTCPVFMWASLQRGLDSEGVQRPDLENTHDEKIQFRFDIPVFVEIFHL